MQIGSQMNISTNQFFQKSGEAGRAETSSFRDTLARAKGGERPERAVDSYKKSHPEHASTVDSYVKAGKKFLAGQGADTVSREDMSMEEYKAFFTNLMDSIPFDISQQRDVEVWTISEKGWEQMKNDPDYEAWILGYTVKDRAFHNPFASWPGYSPSFHTERFGASIEEHLGQSMPMQSASGKSSNTSGEVEDWWMRRHMRFEEMLASWLSKADPDGLRNLAGTHF